MSDYLQKQLRTVDALDRLRELGEFDESHRTELAELMGAVRNWAATRGLPEVVKLCRDDGRNRTPIEAREILAACIAATHDKVKPLTPAAVGKQVGASPETVIGWIRSGKLKAANLSKGVRPRYVIEPDDLAAFLKTQQPSPPPAPGAVRTSRKNYRT